MQQALLGGEERPLAVDHDGAAFEHQRRSKRSMPPARERVVAVVGMETLTPAVEAEVDSSAAAACADHEDRPCVAHPRVVEGELHDLDTFPHTSGDVTPACSAATISTGSNSAMSDATAA